MTRYVDDETVEDLEQIRDRCKDALTINQKDSNDPLALLQVIMGHVNEMTEINLGSKHVARDCALRMMVYNLAQAFDVMDMSSEEYSRMEEIVERTAGSC